MTKNLKTILALLVIGFTVITMAPAFRVQNKIASGNETELAGEILPALKKDSVQSVKAFMNIYKVLMSPRCMNCHPAGDVPLQGDDSHLHAMLPRRGVEGGGLYAMKCTNCHQPTNTPGLNMPPGNPNWHLPPANMKMVFQGKTAHELAKQLINPKLNGNKNMTELIEHASDSLVLWGWNPGEGRTKPPLSYEEFKKAWITWIETGAYTPKK